MLRKGLVKLDPGVKIPENLNFMADLEEHAKEKRYGAWRYEEED